MLSRLQTSINVLAEQTDRYHLDSELIVVDWNPPPDRPHLSEALRAPTKPASLTVRVIEVPPALHQRYRHGGPFSLRR